MPTIENKKEKNMKNYKVIKQDERYTIGQYDEGYGAYITNDGICAFYYWDNKEDAQAAADALNKFEGNQWLGQHGYGNDFLREEDIDDYDQEMIDLYRLFGMTDF